MQPAPGCGRSRRSTVCLAEEFRKLLSDGAAELFGIHDGDGTAIIAGDVVTNADRDQFDRRARLDLDRKSVV